MNRRTILRRLLHSTLAAALAACGLRPPNPTPSPFRSPTPLPPATPPAQQSVVVHSIRLRDGQATAAPLAPLVIVVEASGVAGPLRLRLLDSGGQQAGEWECDVRDGRGEVTVRPGGALGPQSAEVLVDGQVVGGNKHLFVLEAETRLETGQPRIDTLYPAIRRFMEQCRLSYAIAGQPVAGYRSPDNPLLWLRDHTYQARGFRYFETDMTSLVDAFRTVQRDDGSLPDWLENPALGVLQPGRKEVEADLEFLFVQAVVEAWQVTGDDAWLRLNLDAMRRAVDYSMRDGLRWDAEHGLVKRPYTIDMWDFEYGPTTIDRSNGKPAPRHWIDDQTIWGIFHGDNTGLASALKLLALAEAQVGDQQAATRRREQADALIDRLRDLSWNGAFLTHFVPLQPFEPAGVDAASQLSLSNTYALNRNVLRGQECRRIVEEYYRRGSQDDPTVFAEWYSIDPPFPAGSYGLAGRPGEKPGEYVNGGIMPLVGGELARGAFRYGAEQYAFEILHRYHFLISSTGATYLWYYPVGSPGISGIDTLPTDGWGASAMLGALIEGAAGIEERSSRYQRVRLSPRWSATDDLTDVYAVARYAASDGYLAYRWQRSASMLRLEYTGSGQAVELHLLLPGQIEQVSATLDGKPVAVEVRDVFGSRYAVFAETSRSGLVEVMW